MYVYLITNLINHKQYIGITNNYKRRWANHRSKTQSPETVISRAINKYGKDNFKFEVLFSNLSVEDAENKEIELIKQYNTKVPNGYNVADGGFHNNGNPQPGEKNGKAILTDIEVQYLKDHRNIPEYVLYEQFSDKISYSQFKDIYNDKKWKHITTTTEPYPYNNEFSNQFTSKNKLEYDEVVELREAYQNKVYWRDMYKKYQDRFETEWSFWKVYTGQTYHLVMPEVFTEELKHYHSGLSKSGELNGRAKLTWDDVHKIRELHKNNIPNTEIYKMYPQVTPTSIRGVIANKTWKE